jgi:hypothetical protein
MGCSSSSAAHDDAKVAPLVSFHNPTLDQILKPPFGFTSPPFISCTISIQPPKEDKRDAPPINKSTVPAPMSSPPPLEENRPVQQAQRR